MPFIFVDENVKKEDKGNSRWKPAFELFSQVSSWVVVPIVLALIAGKWLDGYFDTKPWIFLTLTGISFLISSFGIVLVVRKYINKIEK